MSLYLTIVCIQYIIKKNKKINIITMLYVHMFLKNNLNYKNK